MPPLIYFANKIFAGQSTLETGMPVAEMLKDLFLIERGYLNGNHFVLAAKEPVLVDTGYIAGFEETEKLVSDLGVRLSDVRLIVNTHCHCDHVGGNRAVQERSGCDIALHRVGKGFIETRDDRATWWRYYGQQAEFFACTRALEDGEVIALGPHEFRVIHTPGHSADGIALYNRREKILISSDSLWENDVPVMTLRIEGGGALSSALESLEKLSALDVRVAYPGHGRPFGDVKAAIARSEKKISGYMRDPARMANDLLKKIIIYTLLMDGSVPEDSFFGRLLGTPWFRETVDRYLGGDCAGKYREIMEGFMARGIVVSRNGRLVTSVAP